MNRHEFMEILKPGLHTTVQDLGRYGYQKYGIVVAGAMDSLALEIGNILVGNKRGEASLEITLLGPKIRFFASGVIAICGADLSPKIDDAPVPLWKSVFVNEGQVLQFGEPKTGARAYLSVLGGIEVKPVFTSKSTYVAGKMGGLGRSLQKGDRIYRNTAELDLNNVKRVIGKSLTLKQIPNYTKDLPIRLTVGPEWESLTEESKQTFLSTYYEITMEADRMGYRLQGEKLHHWKSADIISDSITYGTIQVPANGQPIILMADRQTTGGYTRIGTVISIDLPLLSQRLPGDKVSFEVVSVQDAQSLYIKREKWFRFLERESNDINVQVF